MDVSLAFVYLSSVCCDGLAFISRASYKTPSNEYVRNTVLKEVLLNPSFSTTDIRGKAISFYISINTYYIHGKNETMKKTKRRHERLVRVSACISLHTCITLSSAFDLFQKWKERESAVSKSTKLTEEQKISGFLS